MRSPRPETVDGHLFADCAAPLEPITGYCARCADEWLHGSERVDDIWERWYRAGYSGKRLTDAIESLNQRRSARRRLAA